MYKLLFVLACIPALALASSYPVVQCPGAPAPSAIRIENCWAPPCQIQRGGWVQFEWDFVANSADWSLQLHIVINFLGAQITVPLDPATANACNGLVNGACPYQWGQGLTHRAAIPVPVFIPTGQVVNLQANLRNSQGTVVCAVVQGFAV